MATTTLFDPNGTFLHSGAIVLPKNLSTDVDVPIGTLRANTAKIASPQLVVGGSEYALRLGAATAAGSNYDFTLTLEATQAAALAATPFSSGVAFAITVLEDQNDDDAWAVHIVEVDGTDFTTTGADTNDFEGEIFIEETAVIRSDDTDYSNAENRLFHVSADLSGNQSFKIITYNGSDAIVDARLIDLSDGSVVDAAVSTATDGDSNTIGTVTVTADLTSGREYLIQYQPAGIVTSKWLPVYLDNSSASARYGSTYSYRVAKLYAYELPAADALNLYSVTAGSVSKWNNIQAGVPHKLCRILVAPPGATYADVKADDATFDPTPYMYLQGVVDSTYMCLPGVNLTADLVPSACDDANSRLAYDIYLKTSTSSAPIVDSYYKLQILGDTDDSGTVAMDFVAANTAGASSSMDFSPANADSDLRWDLSESLTLSVDSVATGSTLEEGVWENNKTVVVYNTDTEVDYSGTDGFHLMTVTASRGSGNFEAKVINPDGDDTEDVVEITAVDSDTFALYIPTTKSANANRDSIVNNMELVLTDTGFGIAQVYYFKYIFMSPPLIETVTPAAFSAVTHETATYAYDGTTATSTKILTNTAHSTDNSGSTTIVTITLDDAAAGFKTLSVPAYGDVGDGDSDWEITVSGRDLIVKYRGDGVTETDFSNIDSTHLVAITAAVFELYPVTENGRTFDVYDDLIPGDDDGTIETAVTPQWYMYDTDQEFTMTATYGPVVGSTAYAIANGESASDERSLLYESGGNGLATTKSLYLYDSDSKTTIPLTGGDENHWLVGSIVVTDYASGVRVDSISPAPATADFDMTSFVQDNGDDTYTLYFYLPNTVTASDRGATTDTYTITIKDDLQRSQEISNVVVRFLEAPTIASAGTLALSEQVTYDSSTFYRVNTLDATNLVTGMQIAAPDDDVAITEAVSIEGTAFLTVTSETEVTRGSDPSNSKQFNLQLVARSDAIFDINTGLSWDSSGNGDARLKYTETEPSGEVRTFYLDHADYDVIRILDLDSRPVVNIETSAGADWGLNIDNTLSVGNDVKIHYALGAISAGQTLTVDPSGDDVALTVTDAVVTVTVDGTASNASGVVTRSGVVIGTVIATNTVDPANTVTIALTVPGITLANADVLVSNGNTFNVSSVDATVNYPVTTSVTTGVYTSTVTVIEDPTGVATSDVVQLDGTAIGTLSGTFGTTGSGYTVRTVQVVHTVRSLSVTSLTSGTNAYTSVVLNDGIDDEDDLTAIPVGSIVMRDDGLAGQVYVGRVAAVTDNDGTPDTLTIHVLDAFQVNEFSGLRFKKLLGNYEGSTYYSYGVRVFKGWSHAVPTGSLSASYSPVVTNEVANTSSIDELLATVSQSSLTDDLGTEPSAVGSYATLGNGYNVFTVYFTVTDTVTKSTVTSYPVSFYVFKNLTAQDQSIVYQVDVSGNEQLDDDIHSNKLFSGGVGTSASDYSFSIPDGALTDTVLQSQVAGADLDATTLGGSGDPIIRYDETNDNTYQILLRLKEDLDQFFINTTTGNFTLNTAVAFTLSGFTVSSKSSDATVTLSDVTFKYYKTPSFTSGNDTASVDFNTDPRVSVTRTLTGWTYSGFHPDYDDTYYKPAVTAYIFASGTANISNPASVTGTAVTGLSNVQFVNTNPEPSNDDSFKVTFTVGTDFAEPSGGSGNYDLVLAYPAKSGAWPAYAETFSIVIASDNTEQFAIASAETYQDVRISNVVNRLEPDYLYNMLVELYPHQAYSTYNAGNPSTVTLAFNQAIDSEVSDFNEKKILFFNDQGDFINGVTAETADVGGSPFFSSSLNSQSRSSVELTVASVAKTPTSTGFWLTTDQVYDQLSRFATDSENNSGLEIGSWSRDSSTTIALSANFSGRNGLGQTDRLFVISSDGSIADHYDVDENANSDGVISLRQKGESENATIPAGTSGLAVAVKRSGSSYYLARSTWSSSDDPNDTVGGKTPEFADASSKNTYLATHDRLYYVSFTGSQTGGNYKLCVRPQDAFTASEVYATTFNGTTLDEALTLGTAKLKTRTHAASPIDVASSEVTWGANDVRFYTVEFDGLNDTFTAGTELQVSEANSTVIGTIVNVDATNNHMTIRTAAGQTVTSTAYDPDQVKEVTFMEVYEVAILRMAGNSGDTAWINSGAGINLYNAASTGNAADLLGVTYHGWTNGDNDTLYLAIKYEAGKSYDDASSGDNIYLADDSPKTLTGVFVNRHSAYDASTETLTLRTSNATIASNSLWSVSAPHTVSVATDGSTYAHGFRLISKTTVTESELGLTQYLVELSSIRACAARIYAVKTGGESGTYQTVSDPFDVVITAAGVVEAWVILDERLMIEPSENYMFFIKGANDNTTLRTSVNGNILSSVQQPLRGIATSNVSAITASTDTYMAWPDALTVAVNYSDITFETDVVGAKPTAFDVALAYGPSWQSATIAATWNNVSCSSGQLISIGQLPERLYGTGSRESYLTLSATAYAYNLVSVWRWWVGVRNHTRDATTDITSTDKLTYQWDTVRPFRTAESFARNAVKAIGWSRDVMPDSRAMTDPVFNVKPKAFAQSDIVLKVLDEGDDLTTRDETSAHSGKTAGSLSTDLTNSLVWSVRSTVHDDTA